MIHEDKPSLQERLLRAFSSSDLSLNAETRGDADHLVALGYAGRASGGVSGAVMRLHLAGNPSDYQAAKSAVVRLARHMNGVRNWQLGKHVAVVGELALAYHVLPVCQCCQGRKYEVPEGTPYTTANICKPCRGSGKRPVQRKFNAEIRAVIAVLEGIDATTERAVARLLR